MKLVLSSLIVTTILWKEKIVWEEEDEEESWNWRAWVWVGVLTTLLWLSSIEL